MNTMNKPIISNNNYQLKIKENDFIRDKVSNDLIMLKKHLDFTIFHLTLTWNKTSVEENPMNLNEDLNTLYRLYLVKYAANVNRISKNNRHIQPIFISFLDEGEDMNKSLSGNCKKLHHHCLIAARDETAKRLKTLCGINTIKPKCKMLDTLYGRNEPNGLNRYKIYNALSSTDLKEIVNESVQTRYPMKTLYKYDEKYMMTFNYPFDFDSIRSSMSEVATPVDKD
jgi:hypothetical protein